MATAASEIMKRSLIVWGSFYPAGRAGLYFLSNTAMNAERYEKVLQDHLIPFMKFNHTTLSSRMQMQRRAKQASESQIFVKQAV
jgi:hypothetical protein